MLRYILSYTPIIFLKVEIFLSFNIMKDPILKDMTEINHEL